MIQSLYIHIPFCDHICAYCDFPKVFGRYFDKSLYIERLLQEIDSFAIPEHSLKTIYIGGGTPSSLSLENLERLLSHLERWLPVEELTIEANPESLTAEKLALFKKHHVNRISLGAESSKERILKAMGRCHTPKDIVLAVERAHAAGFDNISLDFIYGYPGTTIQDSLDDLDFALRLSPSHLSFYSLQVEDNTLLKQKGTLVDDDSLADAYSSLCRKLSDNGFERYEVSNFARPGRESQHNLTYWHDEEYYGCGMGASGFVQDVRYRNTLSITDYLKGRNEREKEKVTPAERMIEYLMLNLRLSRGFLLSDYQNRFHEDFLETHRKAIEKVKDAVEIKDGRFFLKKESLFVMDGILLELI